MNHFVELPLRGALGRTAILRAEHVTEIVPHHDDSGCAVFTTRTDNESWYEVALTAGETAKRLAQCLDGPVDTVANNVETFLGKPIAELDKAEVFAWREFRGAKPTPTDARDPSHVPSWQDQYKGLVEAAKLSGQMVWVDRTLLEEAEMLRQYHDADQTIGRLRGYAGIDEAEFGRALADKRAAEERIIQFRRT
jgi:hypothetical protein